MSHIVPHDYKIEKYFNIYFISGNNYLTIYLFKIEWAKEKASMGKRILAQLDPLALTQNSSIKTDIKTKEILFEIYSWNNFFIYF